MKQFLTGLALAFTLASGAFAQEISVEAVSLTQESGAVDSCVIGLQVQNGTAADVWVRLEVVPTYIAGSYSAMVAPASTSFGLKNELVFNRVAAGASQQKDISISGAVCNEIESLELVPDCMFADRSACTPAVALSQSSVIPARLSAPAAPASEGALSGTIVVFSQDPASVVLSVEMAPDGGGEFATKIDFCIVQGMAYNCPLGAQKGALDQAGMSGDSAASLSFSISGTDIGPLALNWDTETQLGTLTSQNGAVNLPVRVDIRE